MEQLRDVFYQIFLSTLSLRRATILFFVGYNVRGEFLSTLSLRRATYICTAQQAERIDFYPRSPCGERQTMPSIRHISKTNFYPRSPCGERQPVFGKINTRGSISIHALLAESDGVSDRGISSSKADFYPRSPCGERLSSWRLCLQTPTFLSTLSLRRATLSAVCTVNQIQYFYPRSPCGERRQFIVNAFQLLLISIHALLAESDATPPAPPKREFYISIHALLAESDALTELLILLRAVISIHALLAESDQSSAKSTPEEAYFYPRSPCGERREVIAVITEAQSISIHALLAESDSKSAQNSGALLRIWNKFYGDCIFMLTGKAVFYPFCPCFFHIFWCEGSGNFMIAFPSH